MRGVKTSRLEKFVKQLEPFTFPTDGVTRFAPTGEPYVTIFGDKIIPEGERGVFYKTDIEAVDAFLEFMGRYIESGTLYWRIRPVLWYSPFKIIWEYPCRYEKRNRPYTVRCRVLCSDKEIGEYTNEDRV